MSIYQRLFFGYGAAAAAATDSDFASVSLLLHGDGTNGSTTITDSSSNAHALTANSPAAISTAHSKWGGASILSTGTGSVVGPSSSTFAFGGSDNFTVEFWHRRTSGLAQTSVMLTLAGSPRWSFFHRFNDLAAVYNATSGTFMQGTTVLANDAWYHYAFSKSGTTCRLFINGNLEDTQTNSVATAAAPTVRLFDNSSSGEYFNGHLDDVRITKGVARYTASFTPPSAPFPNS